MAKKKKKSLEYELPPEEKERIETETKEAPATRPNVLQRWRDRRNARRSK